MTGARVQRIAGVREALEETVCKLFAAVRPRSQFRRIHGELGHDHVLIADRGRPRIIDIEGMMFFDIEWEHVFLQLRFGRYYTALQADDLDDRRMHFYALALP